jgi:cytochrome oxidase Cu insertion factor (SCO1/SenC/PrrC family)
MRFQSPKSVLVIALLGAALGAATALTVLPHARSSISEMAGLAGKAPRVTGTARVGGPFHLVDQTGAPMSDKALRGRILLVVFGYTRSRDVTPASLQVVTDALKALGDNARKVQPVFITLDPEYDTRERMAAFVARFHPRLLALTGRPAEIDKVAAAYFVHPARTAADDRTTYAADIFVMDKKGKYIMRFPFATPVREVIRRLRELTR